LNELIIYKSYEVYIHQVMQQKTETNF